jgi:hypothetical protein
MSYRLTKQDFSKSIRVGFKEYFELALKLILLFVIFYAFWKGFMLKLRDQNMIEAAEIEAMNLEQEEADIMEQLG